MAAENVAYTDYDTEFANSPVDMIFNVANKQWGFLCTKCDYWVDLSKKEGVAKSGARSHKCHVDYVMSAVNKPAVCTDAAGN